MCVCVCNMYTYNIYVYTHTSTRKYTTCRDRGGEREAGRVRSSETELVARGGERFRNEEESSEEEDSSTMPTFSKDCENDAGDMALEVGILLVSLIMKARAAARPRL